MVSSLTVFHRNVHRFNSLLPTSFTSPYFDSLPWQQKPGLPLQNEWRVGLAVSWIVHMDCVTRVCGKLAESTLAAAHALSQAATGARSTQSEGAMVSVAHHQRMGTRDVSWGGRDVSWERETERTPHFTH